MSHFLFAQNIVQRDTVKTYEKLTGVPGTEVLEVPVNFDEANLLKNLPSELKDLSIQQIDLVYTTYKENPSFDQQALNQQRINALLKKFPSAKNPVINWRVIGQSAATDNLSAHQLFHGFVIYYRPTPTKESIESEISFMDDFLKGKVTAGKAESIKREITVAHIDSPKSYKTPELVVESSELAAVEADGKIIYYISASPTTIEESSILYINWLNTADYDVMQKTFDRHPNWSNSLVVMDVTGSMSPYIAKTMAWVKATQDSSQIDAFVFFNDGNMTQDRLKKTGSVGGIYEIENESFDAVYQQMTSTMRKGGGGDCPENNVEATLKGIQSYPECKEIIMMADNWATPRDISLASQLNKPVHIILCGAQHGINLEYIQLAYESGGSVHTIEEDLDFRSIKPGKQFKLGKNYFTIIDGKIVRAEHKA